jgi:C1A family cysteine protease
MSQHRYDVIPSLPDHRDFLMVAPRAAKVPEDALLPHVPPIKDQGDEGSCTGFSLTSAREAEWLRKGNAYLPFAPAFVYYEERRIERTIGQDAGATIRDGLKVLNKEGVCPEHTMPYRAGRYADAPPAGATAAAAPYKIASYHRLISLVSVQATIVAKQPVVLGIAVYPSFEAVGRDGLVPMPAKDEAPLGGHAILVVGYRKDPAAPGGGRFILNNSWGTREGKEGQYFLPYAYVHNADYTFEKWTLAA